MSLGYVLEIDLNLSISHAKAKTISPNSIIPVDTLFCQNCLKRILEI